MFVIKAFIIASLDLKLHMKKYYQIIQISQILKEI